MKRADTSVLTHSHLISGLVGPTRKPQPAYAAASGAYAGERVIACADADAAGRSLFQVHEKYTLARSSSKIATFLYTSARRSRPQSWNRTPLQTDLTARETALNVSFTSLREKAYARGETMAYAKSLCERTPQTRIASATCM